MAFHVPNEHRVVDGFLSSTRAAGNNGCFVFPMSGGTMHAIVSDKEGWEHVSVSFFKRQRCPTWEEMCKVKAMFWDPEDCVLEYHPPESHYVSNHPFCLHLWRPIDQPIPMPPSYFVGVAALGDLRGQR